MEPRDLEKLKNDCAFSSVYYVLEKGREFHKSTPYYIDYVSDYFMKIFNSFDYMKNNKVSDNGPFVNILKEVAEHYGIFALKKKIDIEYINYNLENVMHQLGDLKDNPKEFYSRNDSGLIDIISVVGLNFKDDVVRNVM